MIADALDIQKILTRLAAGRTRKEVAAEFNVQTFVIHKRISLWKRSTGARTLEQALMEWARKGTQ